MTPSMALRVLENHVEASLAATEQQEARLLLHELSYLPLAIVQAAAYINTRNITPREYQSLVARQKQAVPERDSELPKDGLPEHDTTGPIATTLLISLNQIRGDGRLAADYLFLAACMDRKDIPLDLLPASSPREREEAVKILSRYRLVARRPAESSLDLHQLVHRALRKWLRRQERLDEWTGNAIRELYGVFPGDNHGSRSKWRRLLPHARYVLSHSSAEKEGGDRLELARKCAMALYNDGRWREAEELFVRVMGTSSRLLGDEHPSTLTSMNNLAFTLKGQDLHDKAIPLLEECCRLQQQVLGPKHPHTVSSLEALQAWRSSGRECYIQL
ncbi:hypothetical protein EJ04DRAFT_214083 [Polyplosphaeria fusca]|uniref:Kinesin light chain n=1 Tax=Polyplosphaeria fusca TaxID=682080 RepID=A0A9P4R7P8_9PLEO|nr:hypothetical protein EJ04DRAFT_214083 [Polyplosphaeria fusca]